MLDDKGIVIKGLMDKNVNKSSIDSSFIITYKVRVSIKWMNEKR
jgi:hypothetical protein